MVGGVWGMGGVFWDLPALSIFLGNPLEGEGHDAVIAEKWQGSPVRLRASCCFARVAIPPP